MPDGRRHAAARGRPRDRRRAGLGAVVASGEVLEPGAGRRAVVAGCASERFLILPHPEVQRMVEGKVADRDGWIMALNAIQAKALGGARTS